MLVYANILTTINSTLLKRLGTLKISVTGEKTFLFVTAVKSFWWPFKMKVQNM